MGTCQLDLNLILCHLQIKKKVFVLLYLVVEINKYTYGL